MPRSFTDAETIIAGLGGKQSNSKCYCPAHDDKNTANLDVTELGGKVLVKCWAGCSQEAVLDALKARGLWGTKDNHTPGRTTPRPEPRRFESDNAEAEIERFSKAIYILRAALKATDSNSKVKPYLTKRGITILPDNALHLTARDAERVTGKRFPAMVFPVIRDKFLAGTHVTFLTHNSDENARGSDGKNARLSYGAIKGGWVPLAPSNSNDTLLIGEGVETVLSAMQILGAPGIAALSANNMRAINPPPAARYIILADNDEPGCKAAESLAARLGGLGAVVQVAVATGPKGCDWNDLLRSDVDRVKLRGLLAEAPVFKAPTAGSVGMSEFMLLDFPPRRGLMGRWLTTTGLAMLVGNPGALKTRLALSIGYAVARGKSLLGWDCEQRARVMFVDGEMPGELLQDWIKALGPALPDEDFRILPHSILAEQGRQMPDLGTPEGRNFVDADIEKNESELIILDSLSTLVRSGEDNAMEAWRVIQEWSLKHRQRGRAVLFLHHTNKAGGQRGSSMREVVLDTSMMLTLKPDMSTDHDTAVELSYTKGRAIFGQSKAPQILRMSLTSSIVEWTHEPLPPKAPSKSDRVAEMLKDGYEPAAIMNETGATKGLVSQIKKKMAA